MKQALLPTIVLALTGCGTVDGIGQDISDGSRMVRGWF